MNRNADDLANGIMHIIYGPSPRGEHGARLEQEIRQFLAEQPVSFPLFDLFRTPDQCHYLAFEERARWGTCPVCSTRHGEPCFSDVGVVLGRTSSGLPPKEGAHLGRLKNAPDRVRLEKA